MRCILILGRDPQLGLAEFESYSISRGINYKIIKKSDLGVVLENFFSIALESSQI